MKIFSLITLGLVVSVLGSSPTETRGEEPKLVSLDQLAGKYDGKMLIHSNVQREYSFQLEVVSIDKEASTISLVGYCQDCENKEFRRNKCKIMQVAEIIKFVCRKKNSSDEEFTFNGEKLQGYGYASKFPHTINVIKVPN
jgi:hypothetical protein